MNVNSTASISSVDAILGTTVKVKTVDGPVDLQVPAGTQPGTTLLMAKRGVPRLGNNTLRGDHLVKVKVTIPTRPTSDEKKKVEELFQHLFRNSMSSCPSPQTLDTRSAGVTLDWEGFRNSSAKTEA